MRLSRIAYSFAFMVSAMFLLGANAQEAHAFGKKKSYSAQSYSFKDDQSNEEYQANLDSADDKLQHLQGIKSNEDEYKKYSKEAKEEIDKEIRNLITYKGKLKEGIAKNNAEEKKAKEEELAALQAQNEALRLQNALLQQAQANHYSTDTSTTDSTTATKSDDPSAPPVETSAKLSPDTGAVQHSAKISAEPARAPASAPAVEMAGAM